MTYTDVPTPMVKPPRNQQLIEDTDDCNSDNAIDVDDVVIDVDDVVIDVDDVVIVIDDNDVDDDDDNDNNDSNDNNNDIITMTT